MRQFLPVLLGVLALAAAWVLTAPDGGAEGLAPFGVTPREIA